MKKVGPALLIVAEATEAVLRALIEQGNGTVPMWVTVPATKALAVIIRRLRNGK